MRIDAVDLFHVAMPLISPWRTAYGEDSVIESVLVRMESEGKYAWGESSPLAAPCYSPEWAGGIFATVKKWLAPAVVGQNISSRRRTASQAAALQRQPLREGGARHGLVGARRRARRNAALQAHRRDAHGRRRRRRFRRHRLRRRTGRRHRQGVRRRLQAREAQVPAGLGHRNAPLRPQSFPDPNVPHRLQQRLPHHRLGDVLPVRRFQPRDDRAAAAARRPRRPRPPATRDPHADLPRRKHHLRRSGRDGDRSRQLPLHQHQAGPRAAASRTPSRFTTWPKRRAFPAGSAACSRAPSA